MRVAAPGTHLAWLSVAMFLGMTLWFSATAANAPIIADFHLTTAETAWLTMAVQGGFVIGTLISAILNLPDVMSARRLFAAGCLMGAAANASLVFAGHVSTLIGLRALTGAALACVYPPGMKIAAGWFDDRRGAALGVVIGALTIGSAFPHLLAAMSASVPWRLLMLAASALAIAGGGIVLWAVGDGPYVTRSARFEPAAVWRVFADRQARAALLGYLGHMWELYAVWTWIATVTGSVMAFVTIASGAIGSVAAGAYADRLGKARVARWAMIVSALCCVASPGFLRAGAAVMVVFVVVWGVSVVADSAQLSALVAQYSPREYVGTALTVQTCAGFLLTIVSIRLLPVVAEAVQWRWAFVALAPGPIFGAATLGAFTRHQSSARQSSVASLSG